MLHVASQRSTVSYTSSMPKVTRSHAVEDRPLAARIGQRLRAQRTKAGLTQAALADGRYTKAYISALENGLVKPSMAALNFLADRLGVPVTQLVGDPEARWTRLEADLRLAAGEWRAAADAYEALLDGASGASRAELLRALSEAYCRLELGEEAVRAASEAAALYEARSQRLDAAWARYWQAFGVYEMEHADEARRLLAQIRDLLASGQVNDPDLTVRTAIASAMVESRDDEPERALALLEEARSSAGALDDRRRATFLFSLALSYREVGDLEGAAVTASRSLAHFRAAEADLEVGSIENELGLVYLALGNLDRAREHTSAARDVFGRLGNSRWLAHVAETDAQIALASGDAALARERARHALDAAKESSNLKATISALLTLGRAERAAGALDEAQAALEAAADLARANARRGQLQIVLGELAEVVAEAGDLPSAFRLSQEALNARRVALPRVEGLPQASAAGSQSPHRPA